VHFIKYLSNPILVFYQLTFAHVSIFPIVRVKPSFSFSFLFSLYLRYEKSLVGYYAVHEILNYLSTFLTGLVSFTVPEVFFLCGAHSKLLSFYDNSTTFILFFWVRFAVCK